MSKTTQNYYNIISISKSDEQKWALWSAHVNADATIEADTDAD